MLERDEIATQERKWHGAIVLGAVLAALAAMGAILAMGPSPRAGAAVGQTEVPLTGAWQAVPPVTPNNLRDVHMVSANDGWAVGENGTALHYNGTSWQAGNISTTDTLVDVYMVNSTNGYAVGWNYDAGTSEIFKFDGSAWTLNYTTTATLSSINGSSADNIWTVGLNSSFHWDGTQWTFVPLPVERMLFNVRVISDTEAWAFGQYEPVSEHGLILRNTGSGWVQVPSEAPQTIFDAWFTAPNDGWAVGTAVTTTHVHHYDGVRWTWAYTNSLGLFDISMLSPTDGWACGHSEQGTSIAHFYSGNFVPVSSPLTITFLNSIYMTSPYEGWIVGDGGTTLHYTCPLTFSDVQPGDYFYDAVHYLNCVGVISGYADNTFKPFNNTTRGQLCKIIVLARAWPLNCPLPGHFTDVPPDHPFFCYIETLYNRGGGIISGYGDGTFRPGNNVTRGQLSKIIVLAMGWADNCPPPGHFSDVPVGSTFFCYIETAFNHGIISGYADGTFKPGNNATRGQICKIVYQAISYH